MNFELKTWRWWGRDKSKKQIMSECVIWKCSKTFPARQRQTKHNQNRDKKSLENTTMNFELILTIHDHQHTNCHKFIFSPNFLSFYLYHSLSLLFVYPTHPPRSEFQKEISSSIQLWLKSMRESNAFEFFCVQCGDLCFSREKALCDFWKHIHSTWDKSGPSPPFPHNVNTHTQRTRWIELVGFLKSFPGVFLDLTRSESLQLGKQDGLFIG